MGSRRKRLLDVITSTSFLEVSLASASLTHATQSSWRSLLVSASGSFVSVAAVFAVLSNPCPSTNPLTVLPCSVVPVGSTTTTCAPRKRKIASASIRRSAWAKKPDAATQAVTFRNAKVYLFACITFSLVGNCP